MGLVYSIERSKDILSPPAPGYFWVQCCAVVDALTTYHDLIRSSFDVTLP